MNNMYKEISLFSVSVPSQRFIYITFILTACCVAQSSQARGYRGAVSRGSIRQSSYSGRSYSGSSLSGRSYSQPTATRPATREAFPTTRPATRPAQQPSFPVERPATPETRPVQRPVTRPEPQPGYRPERPVTLPEQPVNRPALPVKPRPPGYRPPNHGGNYYGGNTYYHYNNHWHDWEDARRDWMRFSTINHAMHCGTYWSSCPTYSTTVIVSGTTYYYWGGLYYIKTSSGYIVVTPPRGAVVYAIPLAATPVKVENTTYYYYGGTYYVPTEKPSDIPDHYQSTATAKVSADATGRDAQTKQIESPEMTSDDSSYEVIPPPVGATVPYLPEEARKEVVGGKSYFVLDTTWYKPYSSDGDTIYRVVEKP